MFDPDLPVVLSVDSSQFGMGAVIMHNGQPIEFASCTLTETQKKYAQIEKEFLAVQFGLQRFHQYIYGQHVVVETDHLPLIGIMDKGLNDISARLLRMRLRNQVYDYTLVHKPGKTLILADTLSRAFLPDTCNNADSLDRLDYDQIHAVTTGILTNRSFKDRLISAVQADDAMQILISYIQHGWPDRRNMCIEPLKPFWAVRHDLTTHDGLILRNNQIVIPVTMRKQVLNVIHTGHLGVSKCIERAKSSVYWPGYQGQVNDTVVGCAACQENMRANSRYSYESYDIPQYPMLSISMDIFQLDGIEYLVTVDRYSKWPACYELKGSRSKDIIEILRRQFVDFGKPELLVSDNASYFTSYEFESFVKELEIKHITSSPYHSRSNGLAERMNQTIKSNLKKAKETGQTLYDVLAAIRSTPLGGELPSPSVLLQSRNLRDNLHFMPEQLKLQKVDLSVVDKSLVRRQSQDMFNTSTGRQTVQFCVGMKVWCKMGHRIWKEGTIVQHAVEPRSYFIDLGEGKVIRKNVTFLRPYKEGSPVSVYQSSCLPENHRTVRIMPLESNNRFNQESLIVNGETGSDNSQTSIVTTNQSNITNQSLTNSQVRTTRSGRISKPPVRYGHTE